MKSLIKLAACIEGLPKEKGAMVKGIKREKRSKKKKVGREKEMERMKRETMTHKEVKGSLFIPLSPSLFERMIFIKIKRYIPPFLSQRFGNSRREQIPYPNRNDQISQPIFVRQFASISRSRRAVSCKQG